MSRAEGSGVAALLNDYRAFAGARLWLAFALMLLGAFAEGFGILVLVPLAAIAIGGDSGSGPLARLGRLADWLPADRRFLFVVVLFVAAMGVRSLVLYLRERELARLQAGYEASLRLRAAATLARRGWSFASRVGQARMQALLLTDIPRAAVAISQAQLFATATVMLAVQLLLALLLAPALAAIALAILLAGFVLSIRWARRSVASGIALTQRSEQSTGSGFRLHAGLKSALAQGTVAPFLDEYRSSLAGQKAEAVRFARDVAAMRQLAAFGAAIAAALILFVGVAVLHLAFAVLVASLVLFARMVPPAQSLQHSTQYVAAHAVAFAAVERELGGLEAPPQAVPPAEPLEWNELRLDGVSYRHPAGLGLAGATLRLSRGEWLGIGGASGAGKTTLVDLVAGLLEPQRGTISVDGQRLAGKRLRRWRHGLSYVGQGGSLFNDSVRGNLQAEGCAADDSALWESLEIVGLAARVRAFDHGLDESVGDRGSQLSGGERQRLVLARALLRRPRLLILDEATAALDSESEAQLLERLRGLEPRPAALVVAHRPSSLAYCDSIVSIQHGTVEESGTSGPA
jgi:ATP-binding cassette subfamily C protein